MKTLSKTYDPKAVEVPTYKRWLASGYFDPDKLPNAKKRKPYSIAMPPANVTGELHLGHTLYLTTQDILTRWKRMSGFAALWLPGTDHAGIATQILVERALRENGISRHEIGRKQFLKHVWAWKKRYGSRIVEQIKRMGASCDWSREHFTMGPSLSEAVQSAFLKLYRDDLVYRGERVIHWCVQDQTSISDLEVDYREETGMLWYIRYPILEQEGFITVATTRPETMLGDSAVAVNPKDGRYTELVGKRVKLPITNRVVPIIADASVDASFGTGVVKVTPAHDAADFEIGVRHSLERISVVDTFGKMTAAAGRDFQGLDVLETRGLVVQLLREQGLIEKEESISHSVAYCSRSNTVIEPLISRQWFVKTKPLAKKALAALRSRKTVVVPERFTKVLVRWLADIRDWNISRQLWWGHRIPIWYCIACSEPVASIKEPKTRCTKCGDNAYRQDDDTLDTWFSSGLWTFSTLGWPKKTRDLTRFHPTAVLGTAWDILFFWVARMMMFSLYFTGEVPFKTAYLHGLILDERGKKMSKSKGTGIDPIPMMEKYGTDALRISVIVGTTPGLDFRMSEAKIAGARNFCNKLWNVGRYVLSQSSPPTIGGNTAKPRGGSTLADRWITAKLNDVASVVSNHLEHCQFSLAIEALQQFLWKDFADWYVEIHKVEKNTVLLRSVLRRFLILLHPFAPFITETLWSAAGEKKLLMIEPWPKVKKAKSSDRASVKDFKKFQQLIVGLRNMKLHGNSNKPFTVTGIVKNSELVTRLTGVSFGAVQGEPLRMATTALTVPAEIAQTFNVWRQRERKQLEQYIATKKTLSQNSKAPELIRSQAKTDLVLAEERLAEL
ncbi:MAG: valine--tRNA ligase [Candidatus Kerfeldbacteria bacterium]